MKQVLVVVGPTGIGKSELAIKLAEKYAGEIISGDCIQVYQGLDIGSAKVSPAKRQQIPHHLIDILPLEAAYNVTNFQSMGRKLMEEIWAQGKLPIVVGGTGLYIKALLYDYIFLPEVNDKNLINEVKKLSNAALYAELQANDPAILTEIHPNNRQRLIRAVIFNRVQQYKKSEVLSQQKNQLLYDAYIIGLTRPRSELYEVINERVELMAKEGLLSEVTDIIEKYPNAFSFLGMQGIGYKEWRDYFRGYLSQRATLEQIKKHSRRLAKRQYTWFNNQMPVNWYDLTKTTDTEIILAVNDWLEKINK